MPPRYQQFGRVVEVHTDTAAAGTRLEDELALYPVAPPEAQTDFTVRFGSPAKNGVDARNPSLHHERERGFTARGVMASATYTFEYNLLADVSLDVHAASSALGRSIRRLVDSQFTDRAERIGMLYHELALVPAAVFDLERAPIHASGLQAPDGGVTLFGGTGGVGKTSLELHLGRHSNHRFLADDIAVLDSSGWVYPNLAYPKIYGYNAPTGSTLRRTVVETRRPLDRAHWALHSLRGPDRVRRRTSPTDLFTGVSTAGGSLARYVVLVRENRDHVDLEQVSAERAAQMSVAVLAAELSGLLRHVRWHEFNRRALQREPIVRVDAILDRWLKIYRDSFSTAECLIARIPLEIEHAEFVQTLAETLDLSSSSPTPVR